jgi:tRNA A37 threonylcarbamoyltransferase TsaD
MSEATTTLTHPDGPVHLRVASGKEKVQFRFHQVGSEPIDFSFSPEMAEMIAEEIASCAQQVSGFVNDRFDEIAYGINQAAEWMTD